MEKNILKNLKLNLKSIITSTILATTITMTTPGCPPYTPPPQPTVTIGGACFDPFRPGQSPLMGNYPTSEQIGQDLDIVSDITSVIRTYDTASTLYDIPYLAGQKGLTVYQGAWMENNNENNQPVIDELVELWWNNLSVDVGIIGDDTISTEVLAKNQLINNIIRTQNETYATDSDYMFVTTAEPWYIWEENPDLAAAVDLIMLNIYPYFDGVSINDAANYTIDTWAYVQDLYPDKYVIISNTGWPTKGTTEGNAVPGENNQKKFLNELLAQTDQYDIPHFIFETFDQEWRASYLGEEGANFGLFYDDGTAKPALYDIKKYDNASPNKDNKICDYNEQIRTDKEFIPGRERQYNSQILHKSLSNDNGLSKKAIVRDQDKIQTIHEQYRQFSQQYQGLREKRDSNLNKILLP